MYRRTAAVLLAIVLSATVLAACGEHPETPGPVPPPVPKKPSGKVTVSLSAVGDIMMHMPQVTAGKKPDGTYDFTDVFSRVKAYIESADLAFCNLETTIGPPERGFTGYPTFKSPEAILSALKHAGFDIVTTANNHAFDSGEFGVVYTLNKLDEYGLLHTGRARTQAERDKLLLVEKKGIKFAVISYTYATNGMEGIIPKDKRPYMVNRIGDLQALLGDVARAKAAGADVVVLAMHWGDEYSRKPNTAQVQMAQRLFEAGADIIFGCHPHVLQPMEKKVVFQKDGSSRDAFVVYSLGNFISNQSHDLVKYTDTGAIVSVDVVKDFDRGTISITDVRYVPTWVYRFTRGGKFDYRILPLGETPDADLSAHAQARAKAAYKETLSLMGEQFKATK